jgi:hypothetical protein
MAEQPDWRWCQKCQGLFYSGGSSQGVCPADRAPHDGSASWVYSLAMNEPHDGAQPAWRWCGKCQGLFYAGTLTQNGVCPTDGAAHDGGGSADYSIFFEGSAAPAEAQPGWRWCQRCQGFFYAGGATLGACPAGGTHTADGSGLYVLEHQAPALLLTANVEARLVTTRVGLGRFQLVTTPVFSEAENANLKANPGATIHTQDGNQPWCALAGWLDQPAHAADVVVKCLRSGLTVRLDARADPSVQLLPLDAGSPTAALVYTPDDGSAPERIPFVQAAIDAAGRVLTLTRPFAPEERELYGHVTAAISSTTGQTVIEISYTHRYRVQGAGSSGGGETGAGGGRIRIIDRIRTGVVRTVGDEGALRRRAVFTRFEPADVEVAATPREAAPARRLLDEPIREQLWKDRTDFTRIVVEPPPDQSQGTRDETFAHQFSIPTRRDLNDQATFPDLLPQRHEGWDQVPNRGDKTPLLFRYTDQADAFQHLPTAFKLGYFVEPDGSGAGRPPMRAELFLDQAKDEYRVRATLVALPFIEDTDRDELRAYIRDVVLARTVPYVGLSLRAGLAADFVEDFTSGSAENQQRLPTSIVLTVVEKQPEERLVLEFDMGAWDYAIFCELLRRGLTGRLTLRESGASDVQAAIPVRLRLDDVVANGVVVQSQTVQPDGSSASAADAPPPELQVTVGNALSHSIRVSSLRVFFVDRSEVPGVNFDAEDADVLPGGRALGPQADPSGTARVSYAPKRIASYDLTVQVPGVIAVDGGSVDDWLNRVNQDASLQEHELKVNVQLSIPAAGADRVQLVNVRALNDDDPTPRAQRQVLPSAGPTDIGLRLTLAELMGREGHPPSFSIEYDCLYTNGKLSLPQRVAVDPDQAALVLQVLIETPTSRYTVTYDDVRQETDRAGADTVIAQLRSQHKYWNVYASEPEPSQPDGPSGPAGPGNGQPAQEVSILTDLLAPPFASGALTKVFVELSADADGAPKSTLVFDPAHAAGQTWHPASGTIPPFRYTITYLYAGNTTVKAQGTETDLVLLLDPPAPPT